MNDRAIRAQFDTLRSLGYASIGASYVIVGTTFSQPVRGIKVVNTSNANLIVSYDGLNDNDVVTANGGYVYDYASNKSEQAGNLLQPVGNGVWVKQETSAPTSGTVYVVIIYAD